MSKFLHGQELGAAIAEIVQGKEPCCAVAFWGDGAVGKLFAEDGLPEDAKIICDLTMGGTNPKELIALGAPTNRNLKHTAGLHAKVYISNIGLIVGSANASNNGIGFLDVPKLSEAATFHAEGTRVHSDAKRWFRGLWKKAEAVDADALNRAQDAWN